MIEIVKRTKIPCKFDSCFEVFNDLEGRTKVVLRIENDEWVSFGRETTTVEVVDFETGKISRSIKLKYNAWNGWMNNVESLRCIVSYSSDTLFTFHYDQDFKIRDDYNLKEERCQDIYKTRYGACVYHGHIVAFLSKKNVNELIFYDLKKEKIIEVYDSYGDRSKSLSGIVTSDSFDFIFLMYNRKYTALIDKKTRKKQYEFVSESDTWIRSNEIFFDYSNKNSFGVCGTGKIEGNQGMSMFRLLPLDDSSIDMIEIKHIDENLKYFYCSYSFGNDIFLGDNMVKRKGMVQYINKEVVKNIQTCERSNFVIKNKGKDIYAIVESIENEITFIEIMYFVNRDLIEKKIDPDEIERVEYILNMDDKKVEVLKISILNVFDSFCFKSILY